ncbi:FAD-binding protein [Thalassotalea sp. HSM 43]|uniref:flavin monoamine oxidase family protein n=1 Tax=Thalassotalea sp. HSM 43 TaxID=2552945 RepID=UPI0010807F85|nr:FAD-dependent oxidoreductase [Thalassotalea sp. HSM 43]QBY04572.1 FAD-binding protein [Thalassotalea sp. HSM 43]
MQRRQFIKGIAALAASYHLPLYANNPHYPVIIIGAGLSGLNAALQCQQAGIDYLLLEAAKDVGGRIKTLSHLPGKPEVGGLQIGTGYGYTRYLIDQLGLTLQPPMQFERGQALIIDKQLLSVDQWPSHNRNKLHASEKNLHPGRLLSHYLEQHPALDLANWSHVDNAKYDIPLRQYLQQHGASKQAIQLIEHNFNGLSIAEHSTLQLVRNQQSRKLSAPGFSLVKGGNQTLPQAMNKALKTPALTEQQITEIDSQANGYRIKCNNGNQFSCQQLIVTVPFAALRNIAINSTISKQKRHAIDTLNYTPISQVLLKPSQPFWLDDGLPASHWSNSLVERVFALKDNKGQIVNLLCWINGKNALAIDQLDESQCAKLILAEMAMIRPASQGKLQYLARHSWANNPLQGGAYAYFKAGQVHNLRATLGHSEGNVHFAGEHTQPELPGMEAALVSAMHAVDKVKQTLT